MGVPTDVMRALLPRWPPMSERRLQPALQTCPCSSHSGCGSHSAFAGPHCPAFVPCLGEWLAARLTSCSQLAYFGPSLSPCPSFTPQSWFREGSGLVRRDLGVGRLWLKFGSSLVTWGPKESFAGPVSEILGPPLLSHTKPWEGPLRH